MLRLRKIKLQDFRNYSEREFVFEGENGDVQKIIFIIGDNAVGKTSLLEAIEAVSYGISLKAELEKPKIKTGAEFFKINADYELLGRDYHYQYTGGHRSHRTITLNKVKYTFPREVKDSLLKTISFKAKESLEIIRGGPSVRRDWMDLIIGLIHPQYGEVYRHYQKCLDQKNAILKDYIETGRSGVQNDLDLWDHELAKYGIAIMQARYEFIESILGEYQQSYLLIAGEGSEPVNISYQPDIELPADSLSQNGYYQALLEARSVDMRRGLATVGIHRDDVYIELDGRPARHYASQGQQRSLTLSLLLSQIKYWSEYLGYGPILLLDDVCAELDPGRQQALFENLPADSQIFITTTHLVSLPQISTAEYQIIELE